MKKIIATALVLSLMFPLFMEGSFGRFFANARRSMAAAAISSKTKFSHNLRRLGVLGFCAAATVAGTTIAKEPTENHNNSKQPVPHGETFSKPIASIWFRHLYKEDDEFVFIRHWESPKKFFLPDWPDHRDETDEIPLTVSNADIYEHSPLMAAISGRDNKLVRSADHNRNIATVRWSTIYHSETSGPILEINPAMECRIRQYPFRTRFDGPGVDLPVMHMKCVKKQVKNDSNAQTPPIEHNFDITLLSAGRTRPLSGEFEYPEDLEKHPDGYTVVKKSHQFCLRQNPARDEE